MNDSLNTFFDQYRRDCEICNGNRPVVIPCPDPLNGFRDALIMFVYERPGRIGTGLSGRVSFDNDDPTAKCFKGLFSLLGIDRRQIFLTNACPYYPAEETYKDTRPTKNEIAACAAILRRQISDIRPRLVVSLGTTALRTLRDAFPESEVLRRFTLKHNIRTLVTDVSPPVFPLYHTSSRARVTRPMALQKDDWICLSDILDHLNGQKSAASMPG